MVKLIKYYRSFFHCFLRRKVITIILSILLFSISVNAQYYSRHYSLYAGTDGYISSVQVVNDTIYAMCYVGDSLDPAYAIAVFERFDKSGNLISYNPLYIPALINVVAFNNTLIHTNDGGFAYGAYIGYNANFNALVLLKYDRQGDFQWYKEIPDTINYILDCPALVQDGSSSFYLTGNIIKQNATTWSIYLTKTDSLGNLIYSKIIPDTPYTAFLFDEAVRGLCINKKGNIVISGGHGYNSFSNLINRWGVSLNSELDTAGNIIKKVLGVDSNNSGAGIIVNTRDRGYICGAGNICAVDTIHDHTDAAGSVCKLDSNFQLLWKMNVGSCSLYTLFNTLISLEDGNYLAAGQWYDEDDTLTNHINGWIMKFSDDGQIIWNKLYRGISNNDLNGDQNNLYSIALMSDSSILCAGQAETSDALPNPQQQGWLLHLDVNGCLPDSNSCGIIAGEQNVSASQNKVLAYPDPASDQITLQYLSDDYPLTVTVINLLGQQVYGATVSDHHTDIVVDVRSFSPGLYSYRVLSDKGFTSTGSFVINH